MSGTNVRKSMKRYTEKKEFLRKCNKYIIKSLHVPHVPGDLQILPQQSATVLAVHMLILAGFHLLIHTN